MDQETIEIPVMLDMADMTALTRQVQRQSGSKLIILGLFLFSLLAAWLILKHIYPRADILPFLAMLDITLIIFLILFMSFRGVICRRIYGGNSYFFAPRRYTLDARGLAVSTEHTNGFFAWKGLGDVVNSRAHIFIMLMGNNQAHVIPFRALHDGMTPDDLIRKIEVWRKGD